MPRVSPRTLLPPGLLTPSLLAPDDDAYMRLALAEAVAAYESDEVPVGALVVEDETRRVLGRGHNRRESLGDATAHAEMLAISAACMARGSWRLTGCTLYVTLEPCPMCAGAAVQARLDRLVYGATDPKAGACGTLYRIHGDPRLNHTMALTAGVRADESVLLLQAFFAAKRGGD